MTIQRDSWKTAAACLILTMLTLPIVLTSCADQQWKAHLKEREERCNVAVTAVTKSSEPAHDGMIGWKSDMHYRPVFSYSYEGNTYTTAYHLTFESDPFPEKTEIQLYINPRNPKECHFIGDDNYYDGFRLGVVGFFIPLLPLSAMIWSVSGIIKRTRWNADHPQLIDPDDLPRYVDTGEPEGERAPFLQYPLYLTLRGTGLAMPSDPRFQEMASVLYETAERLDLDDRFRALHAGRSVKPLHLFYLNPERTEWMMGLQLPRSIIRRRAMNALQITADKIGFSGADADISIIGCGEERFEREATDLVKYYPANNDVSDMWMLHDLFEGDIRNGDTEPAARSLMLHVDYKGKML